MTRGTIRRSTLAVCGTAALIGAIIAVIAAFWSHRAAATYQFDLMGESTRAGLLAASGDRVHDRTHVAEEDNVDCPATINVCDSESSVELSGAAIRDVSDDVYLPRSAEGRFIIPKKPRIALEASANGYDSKVVTLENAQGFVGAISLDRASEIEVMLHAPDHAKAQECTVLLQEWEVGAARPDVRALRINERGTFDARVRRSCRVRISARASGTGESAVLIDPPVDSQVVHITINVAIGLSGCVLRSNNEPRAGAEVLAVHSLTGQSITVTTGQGGRFRFPNLAEGIHELSVRTHTSAAWQMRAVVRVPADPTIPLVLQVNDPRSLAIEAHDKAGEAQPGLSVRWEQLPASLVQTDSEGRASLQMPESECPCYMVVGDALDDGYETSYTPVSAHDEIIRVSAENVGTGTLECAIQGWESGDAVFIVRGSERTALSTYSEDAGGYRKIQMLLDGGTYHLEFSRSNKVRDLGEIGIAPSETTTVQFDVSSIPTYSGLVQHADSKVPIEGVRVVFADGGLVRSAMSSRDGSFRFVVPIAPRRLVAYRDGLVTQLVELDDNNRVTVSMIEAADITVRGINDEAALQLVSTGGKTVERRSHDGEAEFAGLLPGVYYVVQERVAIPVQLRAAQHVTLDWPVSLEGTSRVELGPMGDQRLGRVARIVARTQMNGTPIWRIGVRESVSMVEFERLAVGSYNLLVSREPETSAGDATSLVVEGSFDVDAGNGTCGVRWQGSEAILRNQGSCATSGTLRSERWDFERSEVSEVDDRVVAHFRLQSGESLRVRLVPFGDYVVSTDKLVVHQTHRAPGTVFTIP